MSFDEVRYETDDGVATVTLNRPARLNAWTPTMEREVRSAMEAAEADPCVQVIVLTGAGRGFCSGLDTDHLQGRAIGDGVPSVPARQAGGESSPFTGRFTYFPSIEKPILAAVNGPAAGSGLVLALACDLRFAGSEAVFTTSFARLGLTAEHGISWLLPRLVGVAAAHDLLLSARKVSAAEALELGLVNRVFPQADLTDGVRAYARELVENCSPRSLRVIKRQIWSSMRQTLEEAVSAADREMQESFASADFQERIAHRRSRRSLPSTT